MRGLFLSSHATRVELQREFVLAPIIRRVEGLQQWIHRESVCSLHGLLSCAKCTLDLITSRLASKRQGKVDKL